MRFSLAFLLSLVAQLSLSGCGSSFLRIPDDPVKALSSDNPEQVALAAYAISEKKGEIKDPGVLVKLFELLKHRDPLVRSAACRALRKLTGFDSGYLPFSDPYGQADLINRWESLAERKFEEE